MTFHIGTSGWSYRAWQGEFYPKGMPSIQWLSFYAQHFETVELNSSFYHTPSPAQLKKWENTVPERFIFSVKAARDITHRKKLKDSAQAVPELMEVLQVQTKGGPVIFQLPPNFDKDLERLEDFLRALPDGRHYAMEFRDPDWHDESVYELLRQYGVAFCCFEKGNLHSPRLATTDFIYVRLHGREAGYEGNYSDAVLRDWYGWLQDQNKTAYIYFDNTAEKIYAVENALTLRAMAAAK